MGGRGRVAWAPGRALATVTGRGALLAAGRDALRRVAAAGGGGGRPPRPSGGCLAVVSPPLPLVRGAGRRPSARRRVGGPRAAAGRAGGRWQRQRAAVRRPAWSGRRAAQRLSAGGGTSLRAGWRRRAAAAVGLAAPVLRRPRQRARGGTLLPRCCCWLHLHAGPGGETGQNPLYTSLRQRVGRRKTPPPVTTPRIEHARGGPCRPPQRYRCRPAEGAHTTGSPPSVPRPLRAALRARQMSAT